MLKIAMVVGSTYTRVLKKKKGIIATFSMTIYQIDKALKKFQEDEDRDQGRTANRPKPITNEDQIKELVPIEYHNYLLLFRKAVADFLPPHRSYNHKITLKEGFTPLYGPIYALSRHELQALRDWITENLSKGFIRASSSPAGAPIIFTKKADSSLRLCVDYRGLNEGTIRNRYLLPLIRETLMRLSKVQFYTTLDVRDAYNMIRIAEGDEWKTAFRMWYGLFESLVMPFGLTNAPADFQRFINDVLRPFLDEFCIAYLDDILIYSESIEEHRIQVRRVMEALSQAGLYLKPEKCTFYKIEVKYLGLIISAEGVKMDPKKIEAIV